MHFGKFVRYPDGSMQDATSRLGVVGCAAFGWILAILPHCALGDDRELLQLATNGTTAVLVRIDAAQLVLPPQIEQLAGHPSAALAGVASIVAERVSQARASLQSDIVYFSLDIPYAARLNASLLIPNRLAKPQFEELAKSIWPAAVGSVEPLGSWQRIKLATDAEALSAKSPKFQPLPSQTDDWQAALAATQGYPVQCVVLVPQYVRETFSEIKPPLPQMLGGGPAEVLVSGIRWLSIGVQPKSSTARLVIQSESAAAAQEMKKYLPTLFKGVAEAAKLESAASIALLAGLGLLQPQIQGDQLILSLDDPDQSAAIFDLLTAAVGAAVRPMATAQTANNLRQLILAMHNYHNSTNALPTYADLEAKQQVSGLSWRVHVLPFIEQAELYQQFKLDEPWDSPHNIRLLEKMPEIFRPVVAVGSNEVVRPYYTTYLAPVGDKTIFGGDKPVRFASVTDGSSNTIAIVEVQLEHAIPWTSPEEYRYDPQRPEAKLRVIDGRVSAALLDGSVQAFRVDLPWHAMFTMNGGEVVNW